MQIAKVLEQLKNQVADSNVLVTENELVCSNYDKLKQLLEKDFKRDIASASRYVDPEHTVEIILSKTDRVAIAVVHPLVCH